MYRPFLLCLYPLIAFGTMPVAMALSGQAFQWLPYLIGATAVLFTAAVAPRRLRILISLLCSSTLTAELANLAVLKRPVFYDQILGLASSPSNAIETALPYVSFGNITTGIIFISALFQCFYTTFSWVYHQKKDHSRRTYAAGSIVALITTTVASTASAMDHTYSSFTLFKIPMAFQYNNSYMALERPLPEYTGSLTTEGKPSILWIIGEGADKREMSLYNNKLDTTPQLDSLIQKRKGIVYQDVVAPGKFTAMSHYMMLNYSDPEHFGTPTPSLFGYLKAAGYHTGYLSSRSLQWGHLLKSVSSGVDHHLDSQQLDPSVDLLGGVDDRLFIDEILLPGIKESMASGPTFFAWQMNGSHAPYGNKSPAEFKRYKDEYRNSILYTDANLAHLISQLPDDMWIFFASDHGKDSMYTSTPESSQVPMFVIPPKSISGKLRNVLTVNSSRPASSLDISRTITQLAGYQHVEPLSAPYYAFTEEIIPMARKRFSCGWASALSSIVSKSSCQTI